MPTYNAEEWTFLGEGDKDVLTFNSLLDLEIQSGGTVPSQPLEQGSFAAYNKLQEPLKIAANIAVEGDSAELQDALAQLNILKDETTIFSVITPEFEYVNMTLESFSYTRKREEGRGVLYAQLNLVEIREVETATTTVKLPPKKCKKKDCASSKNNGKAVLGSEVKGSQLSKLTPDGTPCPVTGPDGKRYIAERRNSKWVYARLDTPQTTGAQSK